MTTQNELTLAESSKIARESYYEWKEVTLEGQRYRVGSRDGQPRVVDIWREIEWSKMTNDEVQTYVGRVMRLKPPQL